MREILFRGKRVDNGKWAEGYYYSGFGVIEKTKHSDWMIDSNGFVYEINPETVGQYTGLDDRNGRKIFEGDIVTIPYSKRLGLPAEVHYSLVDGGFYIRRRGYTGISLEDSRQWCEVIGNVFDNPELISG